MIDDAGAATVDLNEPAQPSMISCLVGHLEREGEIEISFDIPDVSEEKVVAAVAAAVGESAPPSVSAAPVARISPLVREVAPLHVPPTPEPVLVTKVERPKKSEAAWISDRYDPSL